MKIGVLGATGLAGGTVVKQALNLNYEVIAIARNPQKVKPIKGLDVRQGDVTDIQSLIKAFNGVDAVISCIGFVNNKNPDTLMSRGTMNMIEACQRTNVKEFVMMSGILQSNAKELSFLNRIGIKIIRLFYRKIYKDKILAEDALQHSTLNWTIIRPVGLKEELSDGNYVAGEKAKISPFRPLSVDDCADCLLKAVSRSEWKKKIINVGKL